MTYGSLPRLTALLSWSVSQNCIIKRCCCVCPRLLTRCSRLGVPEALCGCHSEHHGPSATRNSAVTGLASVFLVTIADTRQQKPFRELLRNKLCTHSSWRVHSTPRTTQVVGRKRETENVGGLPLSWSKDGVWGCMGHSSLSTRAGVRV